MIRVGFLISHDGSWQGGSNYYRNLLQAIYSLKERRIEPVLFVGAGSSTVIESVASGTGAEVVSTSLLDRYSAHWVARKVGEYLPRNIALERLLVKNGVDLLSHSGYVGASFTKPSIEWIPDFQHIHYPNFFSGRELKARAKMVQRACNCATAILLSSNSAKQDLMSLNPNCAKKAYTLPFVADVTYTSRSLRLEELMARYKFKGKYFHVPNQFWIHKNHRAIVDAIKKLKQTGQDILVLATGSTSDYRQPGYFQDLMRYVEECGVRENFKILGVIPQEDLFALMMNSIALINPSLFEGWSTSVEEAKTLGKMVVLSDIPVHREQNPEVCCFFAPHDARKLAEILGRLWESSEEHGKVADEVKLNFFRRREIMANTYQEVVLRTIARRSDDVGQRR